MRNERTELTRKQFDKYNVYYPSNNVIVKMPPEYPIITPGGINIGFNPEVMYGEGEGSHVADCAAIHGTVAKQVDRLYFNRKDAQNTMSWDTDVETLIDDIVFFHPLISKNCCEILVEDILYKVIPYEDLFVAKRDNKVIPLNGNVILQEVYKPKISKFDIEEPIVDTYKGIVRWNGNDNKRYQTKGQSDMPNLKEEDFVIIEKSAYPFYLERSKWNSHFDEGNQYLVVQKKHIQAVL
jgi:hypothetical protein